MYQPVFVLVVAALLTSPTLANAQPATQSVTAQSLALTAADLGPEWSMCCQDTPSGLYHVVYTNPTGGEVQIYTGIGANTDDVDHLVSSVRDLRQGVGATIKSVQGQGFGDGRAFESELNDGQKAVVSYMFRVHALFASVDYRARPVPGTPRRRR
jgi:hypothetical protein